MIAPIIRKDTGRITTTATVIGTLILIIITNTPIMVATEVMICVIL